MVKVKAGTFIMGNKQNAMTQNITLTYDYYIGKYPVIFDKFNQLGICRSWRTQEYERL